MFPGELKINSVAMTKFALMQEVAANGLRRRPSSIQEYGVWGQRNQLQMAQGDRRGFGDVENSVIGE